MKCTNLLKTGSRNLEIYLRRASMTKLKLEKKVAVLCTAATTFDVRTTNLHKVPFIIA